MMRKIVVVFALLATGCPGGSTSPVRTPAPAPNELAPFVLAQKPASVGDVLSVKTAKSGDAVVARGWVQELVPDRAIFTLVDDTAKRCTPNECATPSDYCCLTRPQLVEKMVTVKVVDEKGAVIAKDAKGLGIEVMKRVVVQGKVEKDPAGNTSIVASGVCLDP